MDDALDPRMTAAINLVGRTGAREVEFGYLHDDVPIEQASWWAAAKFQGIRLMVENRIGPVDALEGLAVRLLTGAQCQHCFRLIALDDAGAWARDAVLVNGTPWSSEDQARAGLCHWRREGDTWKCGCPGAVD